MMKRLIPLAMGAVLLLPIWLGGGEVLASRSYSPPPLVKNKKLPPFELGKLVYETDEYVGPGGKGCLECHAEKLPLRRESLARRKKELPKQVQWCLAMRVKNERIVPGTPEFDGLMEYLYTSYGLNDVVDEDEKIERLLNLGRELFADGDYEGARSYFERALPNLKSNYHIAETHVILGIIYHVLAEPELAKDHFKRAVEADPTIDVNSSLFSPKTVELFYSVKRKAAVGEEVQ